MTPLQSLLVGFLGTLVGSFFTYLGIRRTTGATEATSRGKIASDESIERERLEVERDDKRQQSINDQVDAFISTQTKEIVQLRAMNAATVGRLDTISDKLLQAQADIFICQKERADLAQKVAASDIRLAELIANNAMLQARVSRVEHDQMPKGDTA